MKTVPSNRICRSLHLANFVRATPADGYLFLNLHPRHLLSTRRHGEVFSHIADAAGVPPQRIVMEILEHKTSDEAQLADAVKALKARGCDAIHVSSGGVSSKQQIKLGPNYQVGFAAAIKEATGMPTMRATAPLRSPVPGAACRGAEAVLGLGKVFIH